MADRRAGKAFPHVPSKGGVQSWARNRNGRWRKRRRAGSAHAAGEDPALAPFLQVLDDHVSAHPEQLQPVTTDLAARLDHLVGAVDVDPDAPLEADDEDEDYGTL